MDDNQFQNHIDHIERARERANARIEAQKKRINERLDRQQARLERKLTNKQEEIIKAGLQLLDTEGLDSVTLRSLAKHLNMQAPAIYWHFKNKLNLLDFLAEAILQKEFPQLTPRTDEPWDEWLIAMLHRLRKAMLSHKDGARIVAGAHLYPAQTLAKFMDVALESLVSADMSMRDANLLVSTLVHFTFGRTIEEQSSPTPEELKAFQANDFTGLLKNHPYIARTIEENQKETPTAEFDESLRLIVNGYKYREG